MRKINNLENTIEMPTEIALALCQLIDDSCKMHEDFIKKFREESDLKKRHRAYLHLRDEMERKCDEDTDSIADIKELSKKMKQIVKFQDLANSDPCANCPEKEECRRESEVAVEEIEEIAIMGLDDLEGLLDRMIALCDTVDDLVSVFELLMNGESIPDEQLNGLLEDAVNTTEEVYEYLEESNLNDLTA